MRIASNLVVAAVLLGSMGTAAMAADLVVDVPVVEEEAGSMDWNGFYGGLGVSGVAFAPGGGALASLDGIIGANFAADMFVLGVEGQVSLYGSNFGNGILASGEVRAGVLVTPDVLFYGSVGDQYFITGGGNYVTAGAGVEFALNETTSLDIEYKHWWGTNLPFQANSISGSVLWHF